MILSEQSLEDLNTRLEKKVTMTRFRPNISITGCVPYDEVQDLHLAYINNMNEVLTI
jgi:uncharacterized protein YcbX